jgi:plastocyanin
MRIRVRALVKIFFLVLPFALTAGCSSPEERVPKLHVVEITNMQFVPAELTVQKGDTVEFRNNDIVAHDITEEPEKSWTSSLLAAGKSYKLSFWQTSDYYCSIHPTMKGRIIVQ